MLLSAQVVRSLIHRVAPAVKLLMKSHLDEQEETLAAWTSESLRLTRFLLSMSSIVALLRGVGKRVEGDSMERIEVDAGQPGGLRSRSFCGVG